MSVKHKIFIFTVVFGLLSLLFLPIRQLHVLAATPCQSQANCGESGSTGDNNTCTQQTCAVVCSDGTEGTFDKAHDTNPNGIPYPTYYCQSHGGIEEITNPSDVFTGGTGSGSQGNPSGGCNSTTDATCGTCSAQGCLTGGTDPAATGTCNRSTCDLVAKYINPIIKMLSALVGLVVVASIITGGIQYSTSGGDPQKTAKAKHRISNSILALVAFAFLYALIRWLVPGATAL